MEVSKEGHEESTSPMLNTRHGGGDQETTAMGAFVPLVVKKRLSGRAAEEAVAGRLNG